MDAVHVHIFKHTSRSGFLAWSPKNNPYWYVIDAVFLKQKTIPRNNGGSGMSAFLSVITGELVASSSTCRVRRLLSGNCPCFGVLLNWQPLMIKESCAASARRWLVFFMTGVIMRRVWREYISVKKRPYTIFIKYKIHKVLLFSQS